MTRPSATAAVARARLLDEPAPHELDVETAAHHSRGSWASRPWRPGLLRRLFAAFFGRLLLRGRLLGRSFFALFGDFDCLLSFVSSFARSSLVAIPSVLTCRWISLRTTSSIASVRLRLSSTRSSTKPWTCSCASWPVPTSSLARARAWARVIATNSAPASRYLFQSGDCGMARLPGTAGGGSGGRHPTTTGPTGSERLPRPCPDLGQQDPAPAPPDRRPRTPAAAWAPAPTGRGRRCPTARARTASPARWPSPRRSTAGRPP